MGNSVPSEVIHSTADMPEERATGNEIEGPGSLGAKADSANFTDEPEGVASLHPPHHCITRGRTFSRNEGASGKPRSSGQMWKQAYGFHTTRQQEREKGGPRLGSRSNDTARKIKTLR